MTRAHIALIAGFLTTLTPLAGAAQGAPASPPRSPVVLISAGQGPQRALRHRFAPNQRAEYQIRIDTQMRVQAGERDQSVEMPVMVVNVDAGPTSVSAGRLRYPFRIVGADIEGGSEEARSAVQPQLRGLVGTAGTAQLDPRGTVESFDYNLPEDAPQEVRARAQTIREALAQLMPRFPEEPVGVGATWRVTDRLAMPGIEIEMATIYRLRRWDGDRVELQIRIESGREGSGERMQVELSGSGRVRLVLGTLQTRTRVQSEAEVRARGPNGDFRINLESRNEISPR